jgi:hypothetical protein
MMRAMDLCLPETDVPPGLALNGSRRLPLVQLPPLWDRGPAVRSGLVSSDAREYFRHPRREVYVSNHEEIDEFRLTAG